MRRVAFGISRWAVTGLIAVIAILLFTGHALATDPVPVPKLVKIFPKLRPQTPAFPDELIKGTLIAYLFTEDGKQEIKPPANTGFEWSVVSVIFNNGDPDAALKAKVTLPSPPPTGDTLEWTAKFQNEGGYEIKFHVKVTNTTWVAPLESDYIAKLKISLVRPVSLSFSGVNDKEFYMMKEDKFELGPPVVFHNYDAPHWKDNNDNGDAENEGDRRYPVAYIRDKKVKVTVVVKVPVASLASLPPATPANLQIKGLQAGAGGLEFAATVAAYNGTNTELTATIVSSANLPNTVKFFNPLSIEWEVSGDGGTSWHAAGTTENRVYVLLGEPKALLFESLVDIACRQQDGKNDAAALVDNIFMQEFKPLNLTAKLMDGHNDQDGSIFKYWTPEVLTAYNSGDTWGTPAKLLIHKMGTCSAFASVFVLTARIHGIEVTPTAIILYTPNTFALPAGTPAIPAGYVLASAKMLFSDVSAAQNNPKPSSWIFPDHAVADYNNTIYDPSYGKKYEDATQATRRAAWESANILKIRYTYTKVGAADEIRDITPADATKPTWSP